MNTIKCCECGKFCNPADVGAFYNFDTLEEPEDLFFCSACGRKRLDEAMHQPESVIIGCWWVKPNYVQVAKSVLRQKRKITTCAASKIKEQLWT